MTYEEKLQGDIKEAFLLTIPALGKRNEDNNLLDWKSGELEETIHRQAKLLMDKCEFITVQPSGNGGRKTIFIRFENIVLRGSKRNRFWDIYLAFEKASSRYPQLTFWTLRPEFAGMDDDDSEKYRYNNFVSAIHPHISNRSACFGEFEKPIMALLSSFNYTGAVMLIRKFIDTWNRDSAYWDMNVMNSVRWMNIHGSDREFFHKITFAERVYLKRQIFDNNNHDDLKSFGRLVSFVAKMKHNYKAGIDWKSLNQFHSLINYMYHFADKFIRNHNMIGFIDTLFHEPRRSGFIWYKVSSDVVIRKRLIWFDCRLEDFKRKLREVLLDEATPKMLIDYCLFFQELHDGEKDELSEKMQIKLHLYSEVRCKRVMSEFIKYQMKMTELPKELKDIWCTKENVDNIFNIDFLTQLIDEAKLQCCVIALKRIHIKERKLRNEIATLRGDALQAELFSKEVPEQGVERPSVVQPES